MRFSRRRRAYYENSNAVRKADCPDVPILVVVGGTVRAVHPGDALCAGEDSRFANAVRAKTRQTPCSVMRISALRTLRLMF